MSIVVTHVKPRIGSVVQVDKSALYDDATIEQLLALLEQRGVLVFPRISLNDEEQLALTDRLGTRVNFIRPMGSASDVYKITLDPKVEPFPEYVQGTFFWHMDGLTSDIPPPKATLLTARRLANKGGQTEFASTYAAYENLPPDEKAEIEGLRAEHSLFSSMRRVVDEPSPEDLQRWSRQPIKQHPLVWKHRSGLKSLIIGMSADHVVAMPLPAGRALLARLVEWAAQPEFSYTHRWQEGDLVIWDNTGTLHRVRPYDSDSGRTMHRTTIAGTEAVN
jgi:alpha-ketoglutarate-dependent taurine dioxygenase